MAIFSDFCKGIFDQAANGKGVYDGNPLAAYYATSTRRLRKLLLVCLSVAGLVHPLVELERKIHANQSQGHGGPSMHEKKANNMSAKW